jgi:hypothetical protein
MSPSLGGPVGDMKQSYSPEKWIDIYGRYFFERVAGMLDYCAPQDKIAIPCCRDGQILDNGLAEWYHIVGNLFAKCGIELWSNIETFQRPFPGHGEPHGIFRQIDYRSLYMKLQEASSLTKRLVTYDFFTCMSPNTEWGSSGRVLARYMEIIGQDTALINEIYHR